MKLGRLIQLALIAAVVLIMAAGASASTISTNVGSVYVSTSTNTLAETTGAAATLVFTGNTGTTYGVPSNIDLGDFELACATCTTQSVGTSSATFGAFTFDLVLDDTTDGAEGTFVGTSTGGVVWSDATTISISWLPLQIGPGTSGASSGSFNTTYFTISSPTLIVAPNSGSPAGDTTVQGTINSTLAPEPTTMAMVGGLFLGLAALARKRRA